MMADNSSERKKNSTPEGGVFVKQPSADNEVIGLHIALPSHQRRRYKKHLIVVIIFKQIKITPKKKFKT